MFLVLALCVVRIWALLWVQPHIEWQFDLCPRWPHLDAVPGEFQRTVDSISWMETATSEQQLRRRWRRWSSADQRSDHWFLLQHQHHLWAKHCHRISTTYLLFVQDLLSLAQWYHPSQCDQFAWFRIRMEVTGSQSHCTGTGSCKASGCCPSHCGDCHKWSRICRWLV